jgi:hypothetical protein
VCSSENSNRSGPASGCLADSSYPSIKRIRPPEPVPDVLPRSYFLIPFFALFFPAF